MENYLLEESILECRHLVGHRVTFYFNQERCVGILEFVGFNPFLHNEFQITVDRIPFWPVDPNTVKLLQGKFKL